MNVRSVPLRQQQTDHRADSSTNRVSLDELRTIWNDDTTQYSDEELIRIREWLYAISEVIINTAHRTKPKIIPLNTNSHEAAQSHSLHPCEYGRTG